MQGRLGSIRRFPNPPRQILVLVAKVGDTGFFIAQLSEMSWDVVCDSNTMNGKLDSAGWDE
jgi:hypothetical protein